MIYEKERILWWVVMVLLVGFAVWLITTEVMKWYRAKKERMNDAKRSKRFSWTPIVLLTPT